MRAIETKFNWIDAVRGYAVLGVLAVHCKVADKDIFMASYISLGAKGVQLFYMASAFTLFLSYYNRKHFENYIINFFLRRVFRIAPLFYMAICYWLIMNIGFEYPLNDHRRITLWSIVSHFFFFHGLSPYWQDSIVPGGWSIAVEFIFYSICPFLFLTIRTTKHAILAYIIVLYIGLYVNYIFLKFPLIPFQETWEGYLYGFFPSQAHIFFLGVLSFFYIKETYLNKIFYFLIILFCLTPIIILKISAGYTFEQENNIIISLLFLLFFNILKSNKVNIFVNRYINHLGKISFSMYITHFIIIDLLMKIDFLYYSNNNTINYFIRLPIVFILSCLFSQVTYKFIEIPFQQFGRKIISTSQNAVTLK